MNIFIVLAVFILFSILMLWLLKDGESKDEKLWRKVKRLHDLYWDN